mmetsp:Transcript_7767/g.16627  ORF Transcript_7767/g.16627 Transcript_7767/m.16627 type:complete len:211 (-) Transcript_7767:6-638(-)
MLRCTNTSPGIMLRIWFAGTRESEHPIHRISGDCPSLSLLKNSGSFSSTDAAHSRFCLNSSSIRGSVAPPISVDSSASTIFDAYSCSLIVSKRSSFASCSLSTFSSISICFSSSLLSDAAMRVTTAPRRPNFRWQHGAVHPPRCVRPTQSRAHAHPLRPTFAAPTLTPPRRHTALPADTDLTAPPPTATPVNASLVIVPTSSTSHFFPSP